MHMPRREFLKWGGLAAASAGASILPASLKASSRKTRPIIDVHMHAYPAEYVFASPVVNPISGVKSPIANGADHLAACIAEMKRYNVTKGVVSGGDGDKLRAAIEWHDRDPQRFIAGAALRGSADTPLPPVDVLRDAIKAGKFQVLGEVTAMYAGLTLSDAKYEPYLELAEELDIPVCLHTGTMPPGTAFDPCCRTARARLGKPELIEEAINRHPKLRINLMHCGWPYLDETIAMLLLYPNINVDTGAVSWLLGRPYFHELLHKMIWAGFGKRIMFGSDQMYWPDAIGLAVAGVESANFLTEEQKQDIFHDNAVRFYRLNV
jgi:hypothetical protein